MSTQENQYREHREFHAGMAGSVQIGDLTINRMAFGTMRLTGPGTWGYPADAQEARRILRRAVELGVNYLDTAAYYGPLVTDRLIVEALHPYPSGLVIGTKVGGWRGSDKRWTAEAHPKQLKATVEDNLDRLHLDELALVHFRHTEWSDVPLSDSLGMMSQLQQEGKIRHIGVSNFTFDQIREAEKTIRIASVQNLYNLADRRDEDIVDYCTQQSIPFMPFFPLAVGQLGQSVGPLATLSKKYQATPSQIALAWLLARSPQMVIIAGTGSVAHLEENIAAVAIVLTADEQQSLISDPAMSSIKSVRY
jgi:aryl-alcohol dehydrogenase-like predicted oxidoreductase